MTKKGFDGDLFLIQAIWQDDRSTYRHNNIFTRAESVEAMFEILAKSHPEWSTTDDYTKIGEIDGHWTSVTVFKVEWSDDRSWRDWVNKKQDERRAQIKVEERDRDFVELRRIVEKHGVNAMEVIALAAEK
jgi:hypothetical protein